MISHEEKKCDSITGEGMENGGCSSIIDGSNTNTLSSLFAVSQSEIRTKLNCDSIFDGELIRVDQRSSEHSDDDRETVKLETPSTMSSTRFALDYPNLCLNRSAPAIKRFKDSLTYFHYFRLSQLLIKYKSFLQQYRPFLGLVEDALSRIILYAPSRFISHEDLDDNQSNLNTTRAPRPETMYALLNLWTLFNDTLYFGLGHGNGLTFGSQRECGTKGLDQPNPNHQQHSCTNTVITTARTILSMIQCIAPAIEMNAYSSARNDNSLVRDHRIKSVIARIESIKFFCRSLILILNYSTAYLKFKHQNLHEAGPKIINDNNLNIHCGSVGILLDGGSLRPGESVILASDEEKRIKRLSYVGKRTGRRMVCQYPWNEVNSFTADYGDSSLCGGKFDRQDLSKNRLKWKNFIRGFKFKIGLLLAGELLYVYRPLYWSQKSRQHSLRNGSDNSNKNFQLIKAWIVSFLMDVISRKLVIQAATVVATSISNDTVNIASQITQNELQRRKSRWMFYLLRSPIWELLTHPVSSTLLNIVSRIVPVMGPSLSNYAMEVLSYWHKWQFMLEE